jgi:8-oxo-dGTP pyrophosphatase MutT (NUDIX family)
VPIGKKKLMVDFMEKRDRFKMPVAVHLLLEQDGKLLMPRRSNTGYEDGKWSLPAGHVDQDESATTALVRETKEELGILIKDFSFVHALHKKDPVDGEERIDLFFNCTKWKGVVTKMEPDKCSALEWYNPNELPSDTIEYIKHAINAILQGSKFSEFGWLKKVQP